MKITWERAGIVATVSGVILASFFSAYAIWSGNRQYAQVQEISELRLHQNRSIELTKLYVDISNELFSFLYDEEISEWNINEASQFQESLFKKWKEHVDIYNQTEAQQQDLYRFYSEAYNFRLNLQRLRKMMIPLLVNIPLDLKSSESLRTDFDQFVSENEALSKLEGSAKEAKWEALIKNKSQEKAKQVFLIFIEGLKKEDLFGVEKSNVLVNNK